MSRACRRCLNNDSARYGFTRRNCAVSGAWPCDRDNRRVQFHDLFVSVVVDFHVDMISSGKQEPVAVFQRRIQKRNIGRGKPALSPRVWSLNPCKGLGVSIYRVSITKSDAHWDTW